jgi:hypothetical protein
VDDAVRFEEYEDIPRRPAWADLEDTYLGIDDPLGVLPT